MIREFFITALLALLLLCGGVARGQMVQQLTNTPEEYIYCCSHPEADIVFLGGLQGVYKSTDNGGTWEMVHEFDSTVHIPQSLEDTMFTLPFFYLNFKDASTGFASRTRNDKCDYSFDLQTVYPHPARNDSPGLFMTTDGGVTWDMVDHIHFFVNIQFAGPDTIYAYEKQEKTLYKSVNGGMVWNRVFNEDIDISDYSLVEGNIVYVMKGSCYLDGEAPVLPTVYKSSDGGETWMLILNNEMNSSKAPVNLDIIHFYEEGKGVLMGHKQIFTDNDFTTYNWQEGGFTGILYASRNVQSCYLNSGHVVSTCASADGVQDEIKLRISRDFGRHTSCQSLCGSYLGVATITGCEEDTMFFVAVDDRLYRIDGSDFPPVGVEEYETGNINVYPNPVGETLHVTMMDGGIAQIEMFDMFGRNISVETQNFASLPSPTTTVTTSDIPTGLYVLRVTLTDGTVRTVKVVKQ